MSGDEALVFFFSLGVGGIAWLVWFWRAAFTARRCSRFSQRWPLLLYPAVCAAVLYVVLRRFSSFDVRDDPTYLAFYMVLGAMWVRLSTWFLPLMGLSARDDVIERGNLGAAQAIGGALLGLTLCFAGGNIGDGPGWWVVVFCAFLSTAAFFLLWVLLDKVTGLADTITIERDLAAGVRLAGYFTGTGLILGRAVAGDWESAASTFLDFVKVGWPAAVLWLAAALLEKRLRPSPTQPHPPLVTHGLAPLLLYLGVAVLFILRTGWWS